MVRGGRPCNAVLVSRFALLSAAAPVGADVPIRHPDQGMEAACDLCCRWTGKRNDRPLPGSECSFFKLRRDTPRMCGGHGVVPAGRWIARARTEGNGPRRRAWLCRPCRFDIETPRQEKAPGSVPGAHIMSDGERSADGGGLHVLVDEGQILAEVVGKHLHQLASLCIIGGCIGPGLARV